MICEGCHLEKGALYIVDGLLLCSDCKKNHKMRDKSETNIKPKSIWRN